MLLIIILCLVGALGIIFLIPLKGARSFRYQPPILKVHESDAVLSRRLLKPGTAEYKTYYHQNPQFKASDDRSRNSPGLLSEKAQYYDPGTFAAALANFKVIEFLGALTHGNDPGKRVRTNPELSSRFIKEWLTISNMEFCRQCLCLY